MQIKNYISASCTIRRSAVYKDEVLIFENRNSSPADFLLSVYRHFEIKYPKFYKMDQLSKLGFLAAEILLKNSFNASQYQPADIGLILANANSSLDTDIKYFETTKEIASPALFVYTLPNIMTGEICIRHNFKGENAFFIFNKFETGFIRQYVNNLLNNDTLQACICGWVEVLGDKYEAILFLIEKKPDPEIQSQQSNLFTIENIRKIYQSENG